MFTWAVGVKGTESGIWVGIERMFGCLIVEFEGKRVNT